MGVTGVCTKDEEVVEVNMKVLPAFGSGRRGILPATVGIFRAEF